MWAREKERQRETDRNTETQQQQHLMSAEVSADLSTRSFHSPQDRLKLAKASGVTVASTPISDTGQ